MSAPSDKKLTDRRQSAAEMIAYYTNQARLARLGVTQRRSEEFFLRQAEWFRNESR